MFGGDLLIGLVTLASAYALLWTLSAPSTVAGHLLYAATGGLNFVWLAVMIAMMWRGERQRQPGLVAAPFVFAALWFGASVAHRSILLAQTDPAVADRTVPEELRNIRTLTFVTRVTQRCCGEINLLGNRTIDLYVHAAEDEKGRAGSITTSRRSERPECQRADLARAVLLFPTVRHCIERGTADQIPDGLVIRTRDTIGYYDMGCCNVRTISIRTDGQERIVATWRSGKQMVLSYLPMFGLADRDSSPLWSLRGSGPLQIVDIGGPQFGPEDLAAAAYGVAWGEPPPRKTNVRR